MSRRRENEELNPAEPDAREELARKALAERSGELNGGESPEEPGAALPPARDPAQDAAAFSAVLEVAICAGARLIAWRWPATALFVGATVLPKVQGFAEHMGGQLGPAVGERFPAALPAAGGICSMLAWWLRALPPPRPATPEPEKKRAPAEPLPPDNAFTSPGGSP